MTETLPDSTPAALGATLARGVVLIALMLPPVRRAIASSGLGWAYLVALAFALALVGVPLVRAFARAWGVLDTPAARKVHAVATPLLGGAAVYAAFAAAVLFNFNFSVQLKGVALGATIIVAVGVLDDLFDVAARWKLAGQIVAVVVAMAYGVVLDTVPTAWPGSSVLNVVLTLLWFLTVAGWATGWLADTTSAITSGIARSVPARLTRTGRGRRGTAARSCTRRSGRRRRGARARPGAAGRETRPAPVRRLSGRRDP